MYTLYYLQTTASTFRNRRLLRSRGLLWDRDAKLWWGSNRVVVEQAGTDLHEPYEVVQRDVDAWPRTKAKPRGRAVAQKTAQQATTTQEAIEESATEENVWPKASSALEWELASTKQVVTSAKPVSDAEKLAALVRVIANESMREMVNRDVNAAVNELRTAIDALQAAPGRTVTVRLEALETTIIHDVSGPTHRILAEVLRRINAGFRNIFLAGPSGSGKTTLARQVADALQLPFASISCSAGMSEGVLLGRLLPTGEAGRFEYSQSPFVRLYEDGGVFLLDEIDAADPNTLLVLNSATSNGHLDVPNRLTAPEATRHANFVLIVAGNTWGQGATREYVGRNQLDAAFLSRFAGAAFDVDYDAELEQSLTLAMAPKELAAQWHTQFMAIRSKLQSVGVRRVWGTRELVAGAKLLHIKASVEYALNQLFVGWTRDEIAKAEG